MGASEQWYIYTTVIDGTLDFGAFTSSDFSASSRQLPTLSTINYSGTAGDHIMYAWHNVPGLQKFGTYMGNGSADGTYVELGFKPSVVIVKISESGASGRWFMYDSARGETNPIDKTLNPDDSRAEESTYDIDFLSNGFKHRYADSAGYTNYDDHKYIYAAWAEAPTVNLYGGQSNAR